MELLSNYDGEQNAVCCITHICLLPQGSLGDRGESGLKGDKVSRGLQLRQPLQSALDSPHCPSSTGCHGLPRDAWTEGEHKELTRLPMLQRFVPKMCCFGSPNGEMICRSG